MIGPFTYTNANVQAALARPVGPAVDEARHAQADREAASRPARRARARPRPASICADGVERSHACRRQGRATGRSGSAAASTRRASRGRRARARRSRPRCATTIRRSRSPRRSGSTTAGRVRRVLVAYATPQGTQRSPSTRATRDFGATVDARRLPPPRAKIKDITPVELTARLLPGECRRRARPRRAARRTAGRRSRSPPSRAR